MNKENRKYFIVLIVLFAILVVIQLLSPSPINWNLSYRKTDKIPFGTSALNFAMPKIFPNQEIQTKANPLYNVLSQNSFAKCNYIIINQTFQPDKLDSRELLSFIYKGNNAFVSANYFSGKFADTFKIKTDNIFKLGYGKASDDSALIVNAFNPKDTVKINFVSSYLKNICNYEYEKGIENSYFTSFDTSKTIVLGKNSQNQINFIRLNFGNGNVYLNTVPEAFSNYHFVHPRNNDYVFRALSYLPLQRVFWDEYYKVGNIVHESPLRVIFNNPALYTAYVLLIFSLLLFILVGVKRKQRIIPVIYPMRNTTVDFVDVVGTLYYQTGNHKNIADKKITFFLSQIRTTFQTKTTLYDDAFIERISNLSGIEKQKIHNLFYFLADITAKNNITQTELLTLNKMMEEFKKESKR